MIYSSPMFGNVDPDLAGKFVKMIPFVLVPGVDDVSGILRNTTHVNGSPQQPAISYQGTAILGINGTLYNRIIFYPSSLDMGNLTAVQTRDIKVWNGYFEDKDVSSLTGLNVDGISLTQPDATPFTFKALDELTYVMQITTDGPATIDGSFTWTIGGVDYKIVVFGRRIILLQVPPNWSSPVVEELNWLTDVIRAFSGKEQRRSLRSSARRNFDYDFMLTGINAQIFENQLYGWQNRTYGLPVYTDGSPLTGQVVAGAMSLPVVTPTFSFNTSQIAMIGNPERYEIVQIASIGDNIIELSNPTQYGWSAGINVYPITTGRLPTEVPYKRQTGTVITGKMQFSADPGGNGAYTPTAAAETTYAGYEVITYKPNWSGGIDFSGEFEYMTHDSKTGVADYILKDSFPRIIRQHEWLLGSRADILKFRQLLGRLRGQYGTVLVPTWNQDFTPVRDHFSTEASLYVVPNQFRQLVGSDANRNKLMIRLADGTVLYRTITGVAAEGDYDVVGLDQTFGRNIALSSIVGIHLLLVSRLATDKVSMSWRTNRVITATLSFKTVPV